MCVEDARQNGANGPTVLDVARISFRLQAKTERIAQQCERVFTADDADKFPGAMGQDSPVDVGGVFNDPEKAVEGLVRVTPGDAAEHRLRLPGFPAADAFTHRLSGASAFRRLAR